MRVAVLAMLLTAAGAVDWMRLRELMAQILGGGQQLPAPMEAAAAHLLWHAQCQLQQEDEQH